MKDEEIRPLALCIVWRDDERRDELLVCEFYDRVKGETFYRPLGGGIEFWERGEDALRREIREELGVELVDVRYTATLENIFVHESRRGHEIVLLYEATLADPSLYERETIAVNENGETLAARWMPLRAFQADGPPLYPDGLPELLANEDATV
jgi:ADP-ribose pyrophosphatase YjhB (NUDIX family)